MAEYRNQVKNSRGRWTGGGFGVKGAIKGAITASILNCGTDFLYSFGDSAREKRDNQEIQNKLRSLYNNPQTKQQLVGGIRTCVLNILEALQDEMLENDIISTRLNINYEKAITLYDNTRNWEKDQKRYYDNIAQCIVYYPVNVDFYKEFESEIKAYEENDISRFIEFWGFDKVLSMFGDNPKDQISVMLQEWELKQSLEMYYEKYKFYQPSDDIRREREEALKYKNSRRKEDIEFADNVRRRFGILTKQVSDQPFVINLPLYILQPGVRPNALINTVEMDQFIFFDNGEIVITDYVCIIGDEVVELKKINEIWYGIDERRELFLLQLFLKGNEKSSIKKCRKKSTIDILTMLNLALEPYREIEYITHFDTDIRDEYMVLRNSKDIKAIDNEADIRKKKKIEEWYINKRRSDVEEYIERNRTEIEIQFSASVRRRFQKLLTLPKVDERYVVKQYIYEWEAENKVLPDMMKCGGYKPDEFILYADDRWVLTDYMLYGIYYDNEDQEFLSIKLEDINELYETKSNLKIFLKVANQQRKKDLKSNDQIVIAPKFCEQQMPFLINIVLEPHREIDYIPSIANCYLGGRFFMIVEKYESEEGDFDNFILHEVDDESELRKRNIIESRAKKRVRNRKKIADSYRAEHSNSNMDRFAIKFKDMFMYLYEINNKEVRYFDKIRNHYDYEICEVAPDYLKSWLERTLEKGMFILWAGKNTSVILTELYLFISGKKFNLVDIKHIFMGETLKKREDDSGNDPYRCWIEFVNGKMECIITEYNTLFVPSNVWNSINYTLAALHNLDSPRMILQKQNYLCENCKSFDIKVSEGILGNKYRCVNCNNKSKRKILIFQSDEKEEVYKNAISNYKPKKKLVLEDEKEKQNKKEIILCKKCGKEISSRVKFCNFCGQPIDQLPVKAQKVLCVYCGKEIAQEAKFCNFCGQPHEVN